MKNNDDYFLNILPNGDITNIDDRNNTEMDTDDNDILHGFFITKKGMKGVK
jgi:hypothetical protein